MRSTGKGLPCQSVGPHTSCSQCMLTCMSMRRVLWMLAQSTIGEALQIWEHAGGGGTKGGKVHWLA